MTRPGLPPESPATPSASTPAWRIFAIPAVAALLGYVLLYRIDSGLRVSKGPWEVTFLRTSNGAPALAIRQPHLGIGDVSVRLLGETVSESSSSTGTVLFDAPRRPLPFGTNAFDDLMYLPGTVVLHCFGHEIQMLPRGLFLNRREHPWAGPTNYDLTADQKLPTLEPPRKRGPFSRTN